MVKTWRFRPVLLLVAAAGACPGGTAGWGAETRFAAGVIWQRTMTRRRDQRHDRSWDLSGRENRSGLEPNVARWPVPAGLVVRVRHRPECFRQ